MTRVEERRAMKELVAALAKRDIGAVRVLLDRGLSMSATYENTGLTPLLLAISDVDSPQIVRLLLARGPDLKLRDAGGYGPVARAAMGLKPENLSVLLDECGADPYEPCGNGASPLVNAIWQSRWDDDPRAAEKLREVIRIFLRHGVDPDRPDSGGAKLSPRQVAEQRNIRLE